MHLTTRNVNTAFNTFVKIFAGKAGDGDTNIVRRPSRNGSVLVIDEPVTVTYTHPRERVLFNAARDCNPFFHLYEALWMLAGRNDVAPLAYYTRRMAEFSDDGETLNGSYGDRWRHTRYSESDGRSVGVGTVDQLDLLVSHLKADPNSRRAVLQMWNVEDDLLKVGGLRQTGERDSPSSKDVCCNLSVMFSLRHQPNGDEIDDAGGPPGYIRYLDMTVTNRSNDLVWGMLGANYVHFTLLQEYVAARLGAEVGRYHHFTNNLHVYDEPGNPKVARWEPERWLTEPTYTQEAGRYGNGTTTVQLVKDPAVFERELPLFVSQYDGVNTPTYNKGDWDEPFLRDVAAPALRAFRRHKEKCPESAAGFASQIKADDWQLACTGWLERRSLSEGRRRK